MPFQQALHPGGGLSRIGTLPGFQQLFCGSVRNRRLYPGRPCGLQTALYHARNDDALYLAQGNYINTGEVVVAIEHSISLLGGWDGTQANPVKRDADAYVSILDGEDQRRVVAIAAGTSPTIDGLTITNGNATGLGGSLFSSDAGGGIYSLNASPIIRHNIITNNTATTQSGERGMGGGVYIQGESYFATLGHNQFSNNTAGSSAIHLGDGGGLFLNGPGLIHDNVFENNKACQSCPQSYGGGIYIGWTTAGVLITRNRLENNLAGGGGGISLIWSAAQVIGNDITGNSAESGGGLYTNYDKGSKISNNTMLANTASAIGGGMLIRITLPSYGNTSIANNIVADNTPSGIAAYSDWHIATASLVHNTLVNNGEGVNIGRNMTATLINNIIADHAKGVTVTHADGTANADHTLFWGNTDDGIRGDVPVDGDPDFVDPANDNYHIDSNSAAIDAGTDTSLTTDFDGTPRPTGTKPDIGADEYAASAFSCSGDNVTIDYDFGQLTPVVCTATGSLTTLGRVNILPGANVTFKAGTEVELGKEFTVKSMAVFHASIIP